MVRRLRVRLAPATIDELLYVMESDYSGRPPLPKGLPGGSEQLIALKQELPQRDTPLVSGLDIMEISGAKNKLVGVFKAACYQAQLDEEFDTRESGVEWFRQWWEDNRAAYTGLI
jgi:hypothetical protein